MPRFPRASPRPTSRGRERELLAVARSLPRLGLVVGTAGNASVRIGERVRITPTRTPYERLRRRDLVTLDLDGNRLGGGEVPSREAPLHVAVHRDRHGDAVVHTHSPHATAWSFLGEPLAPATEEISYYGIGSVPTVPPLPAGSAELAEAVAAALAGARATLLAGHGVVAVGPTPRAALEVAQAVEHQAQVCWLLRR